MKALDTLKVETRFMDVKKYEQYKFRVTHHARAFKRV
jgi:hypothetical protein